jgi:hypothetical protein
MGKPNWPLRIGIGLGIALVAEASPSCHHNESLPLPDQPEISTVETLTPAQMAVVEPLGQLTLENGTTAQLQFPDYSGEM